ncbi:MAG TPA: hypothetical protein VGD01_02010 [Candidatus Elarobacter sp.]|jgi:uncharacterized repeat protein (TIGR01451 family)
MRSLAALMLMVLALAVPGMASAKPNVTLKLTGSLVTKAADGHVSLTPVDKAQPKAGDEIQYDIVALNAGDSPALRLVPTGRIPTGTAYVDGSAKGLRAHPEFSLDGGKTWSAAPTVRVRLPDGTTAVKKADSSLYTAVRFVTDGAIAPRQSAAYSYEVRVK